MNFKNLKIWLKIKKKISFDNKEKKLLVMLSIVRTDVRRKEFIKAEAN
jgi:hypothetical protein